MDKIFQWLESVFLLGFPNYFWVLCVAAVVIVLLCVVFIPILVSRSRKIKTLKAVLAEERETRCNCSYEATGKCTSEQEGSSGAIHSELEEENKRLVAEISGLQDQLDMLTAQAAESQVKLQDAEELIKRLTEELNVLKARAVENAAEITSFKATNEVLSKSIDELKALLATKNEEIESLNATIQELSNLEREAHAVKEDNKVLLRAVGLIMDAKDNSAAVDQPLPATSTQSAPVRKTKSTRTKKEPTLTLTSVKKPEVKSVVVLDDASLETLKRPELMHLAKAEGVTRFARKSNDEIIRLIRENRSKKK